MGRYVVKLPDIGEGMTEAEIVAWHVAPGQVIREEDPLVDVMTDKATVELPAPVAGTVVAINGRPGERRAVGSDLVVLDVAGEGNVAGSAEPIRSDPSAQPKQPLTPTLSPQAGRGRATAPPRTGVPSPRLRGEGQGEGQQRPPVSRISPPGAAEAIAPAIIARRPGEKPLASPAVRRRAWDLGIGLQFVPGSGPGGRITQQDLDAYIASGEETIEPAAAAKPGLARRRRRDAVEDVPIVGLRRAIAEHLQQAKRHIPHFSYVEEVDVTALEELREQLNLSHPDRERLTLLPFLMSAIVAGIAAHPQVNARYDDEAGILHRHAAVHLGIATQTEGGLMVPVVRHAEALDLWQSAAELRRLAGAARAGKTTRDELSGSTITITSLGRLGGIAATPIINYPEVAIVGVNRIAERPVVRDGQIVIRKMMNLSSSFDHRIVDGWEAASFIQRVRELLEQPARLFIG
jgi:2-oxoisovalerate dehydrogenase E2 component (dihydrolipoyl transacylase)